MFYNLGTMSHFNTYFHNIGLSWEETLAQCPPGIVPACHNSEESVTVSGPVEGVRLFVESLKEKGIFAREVQSAGVAFHSYFMKDVAPELKMALDKVWLYLCFYLYITTRVFFTF